jgi:hypothetical protein
MSMFDQMSMPVLFAVLIVALAVVSAGVFVGVRILAKGEGAGEPAHETHALEAQPPAPAKELDQR